MNRESSRSHCIFTVYIEMQEELKVLLNFISENKFYREANPVSRWANLIWLTWQVLRSRKRPELQVND